MEIDIAIDSFTDCLILSATGERFNTTYRRVIHPYSAAEVVEQCATGWKFNWAYPFVDCEVYELTLVNDDFVQGRIAFRHIRDSFYTHVEAVEAAPQNVGSEGRFKGVGAHLFAIACRHSWEAGNEGYVMFTAKTNLIEHYQKSLGAQLCSAQNMFIDSYNAINLINKYFPGGIYHDNH